MTSIYCPFRKEHVAAQPEEVVRQNLLKMMIERLGYPSSGIVVEKALSQLPHLSLNVRKTIPDRRVDILVYTKCKPLLLVECKAIPLKHTALQQVAGYNHYIEAPYLSVANSEQVLMGWYEEEEKKYRYINFLPTYEELVNASVPMITTNRS